MLQALVQHGADINAKDIDGNTPCHFCSEYGHRYCLKFLLTKGPSLFSNNNEDKSAIDVAINNDILTVSQDILKTNFVNVIGIPRIHNSSKRYTSQKRKES